MNASAITTIFTDIGGVLLTNGWDRQARARAAKQFEIDYDEMQSMHQLLADTYELGKITLSDYLKKAIFYRHRSFTEEQFKEFMFAQSHPLPGMLELLQELKSRHRLKIVAVNNEGRELNEYRVEKFKLGGIIDFFVSSCTLHVRKPDPEIFHLALELSQVSPHKVVYLEDRPLFVQVAADLGIRGIHHTDAASTQAKLAEMLR